MHLRFPSLHSLKSRIALATLAIFILSSLLLGSYASHMLQDDLGRVLGAQQFATVSLLAGQVDEGLVLRQVALEIVAKEMSPALLVGASAMQRYLTEPPAWNPATLTQLVGLGELCQQLGTAARAEDANTCSALTGGLEAVFTVAIAEINGHLCL